MIYNLLYMTNLYTLYTYVHEGYQPVVRYTVIYRSFRELNPHTYSQCKKPLNGAVAMTYFRRN